MLAQLGADVDAMVIDLSNVVEPEKTPGTKKTRDESTSGRRKMRYFCRFDDHWRRNRGRLETFHEMGGRTSVRRTIGMVDERVEVGALTSSI